ncbi:hypothetical protein HOD38_05835 [archaeon]|jgi:hypothetical protein|nr:hypothetical protein [archaeon]MBT4397758.1 hypothetical protein [archaeon]MBT4440547.1 hypothetical protein [archaeon]
MEWQWENIVVRDRVLCGAFTFLDEREMFVGATKVGEGKPRFALGFYQHSPTGFDSLDCYLFDDQGDYVGKVEFLTGRTRVDIGIDKEHKRVLQNGLRELIALEYVERTPVILGIEQSLAGYT